MMSDDEIRETIRQMLADWDAATPEQRSAALEKSWPSHAPTDH